MKIIKIRILLLKVVLLSSLLSSCDFISTDKILKKNYVRDEDYSKTANKVTREVARKLKQEKGLHCAGKGGAMMSDIQEMALSFDLFQEVDLSEARELLVYATTEYLNAINQSREVRPYLHNYPFLPENVKIMIWIHKPDGHDVPIGSIDFMSSVNGRLIYKMTTSIQPYSNKKIHEETYEEALKILKDQEDASQTKAS